MRQSMRWDEDESVAANASARLAPLVADYFARGRKLDANAATEELDDFRLRSKRLRCTLELFRACYGPGLDERLARLREAQQRLDGLHDCAVTLELLGSRVDPKAVAYLESKSAENREGFLKYWRETFDAPGQETWWVRYLARARRS